MKPFYYVISHEPSQQTGVYKLLLDRVFPFLSRVEGFTTFLLYTLYKLQILPRARGASASKSFFNQSMST